MMKTSRLKFIVLPVVIIVSLLHSPVTPFSLKLPVASAQCTQVVNDQIVEVPCLTVVDPAGDGDGDGVANGVDNCPNVANADQLNTYGGSQGDACESATANNGAGTQLFQQSNTSYQVYGDCYTDGSGNTQCQQIATLELCSLPRTVGASAVVPNPSAPQSTQKVLVTLMSNNSQGTVYQLNVQSANGANLGAPLSVSFSYLTAQACGGSRTGGVIGNGNGVVVNNGGEVDPQQREDEAAGSGTSGQGGNGQELFNFYNSIFASVFGIITSIFQSLFGILWGFSAGI